MYFFRFFLFVLLLVLPFDDAEIVHVDIPSSLSETTLVFVNANVTLLLNTSALIVEGNNMTCSIPLQNVTRILSSSSISSISFSSSATSISPIFSSSTLLSSSSLGQTSSSFHVSSSSTKSLSSSSLTSTSLSSSSSTVPSLILPEALYYVTSTMCDLSTITSSTKISSPTYSLNYYATMFGTANPTPYVIWNLGVTPTISGTYLIGMNFDSGMQLTFNGMIYFNTHGAFSGATGPNMLYGLAGSVSLVAGQTYPINIQYCSQYLGTYAGHTVQLLWSLPNRNDVELIPVFNATTYIPIVSSLSTFHRFSPLAPNVTTITQTTPIVNTIRPTNPSSRNSQTTCPSIPYTTVSGSCTGCPTYQWFSGGSYTFVAPSSCNQAYIQLWGAAGQDGSLNYAPGGFCGQYGERGRSYGGYGGYTEAVVTFSTGSSYTVIVGSGGNGYNTVGGGVQIRFDGCGLGPSSGGGLSGLYDTSNNNPWLIAGGGGGGGSTTNGGAGGGLQGLNSSGLYYGTGGSTITNSNGVNTYNYATSGYPTCIGAGYGSFVYSGGGGGFNVGGNGGQSACYADSTINTPLLSFSGAGGGSGYMCGQGGTSVLYGITMDGSDPTVLRPSPFFPGSGFPNQMVDAFGNDGGVKITCLANNNSVIPTNTTIFNVPQPSQIFNYTTTVSNTCPPYTIANTSNSVCQPVLPLTLPPNFVVQPVICPSNRTFYVDQLQGNDVNTGLSPVQAWATLTYVNLLLNRNSFFNPGDTILFCNGDVYMRQSLTLESSNSNVNVSLYPNCSIRFSSYVCNATSAGGDVLPFFTVASILPQTTTIGWQTIHLPLLNGSTIPAVKYNFSLLQSLVDESTPILPYNIVYYIAPASNPTLCLTVPAGFENNNGVPLVLQVCGTGVSPLNQQWNYTTNGLISQTGFNKYADVGGGCGFGNPITQYQYFNGLDNYPVMYDVSLNVPSFCGGTECIVANENDNIVTTVCGPDVGQQWYFATSPFSFPVTPPPPFRFPVPSYLPPLSDRQSGGVTGVWVNSFPYQVSRHPNSADLSIWDWNHQYGTGMYEWMHTDPNDFLSHWTSNDFTRDCYTPPFTKIAPGSWCNHMWHDMFGKNTTYMNHVLQDIRYFNGAYVFANGQQGFSSISYQFTDDGYYLNGNSTMDCESWYNLTIAPYFPVNFTWPNPVFDAIPLSTNTPLYPTSGRAYMTGFTDGYIECDPYRAGWFPPPGIPSSVKNFTTLLPATVSYGNNPIPQFAYNNAFILSNHLAFLDNPGEFFYNADEDCLYLIPYSEQHWQILTNSMVTVASLNQVTQIIHQGVSTSFDLAFVGWKNSDTSSSIFHNDNGNNYPIAHIVEIDLMEFGFSGSGVSIFNINIMLVFHHTIMSGMTQPINTNVGGIVTNNIVHNSSNSCISMGGSVSLILNNTCAYTTGFATMNSNSPNLEIVRGNVVANAGLIALSLAGGNTNPTVAGVVQPTIGEFNWVDNGGQLGAQWAVVNSEQGVFRYNEVTNMNPGNFVYLNFETLSQLEGISTTQNNMIIDNNILINGSGGAIYSFNNGGDGFAVITNNLMIDAMYTAQSLNCRAQGNCFSFSNNQLIMTNNYLPNIPSPVPYMLPPQVNVEIFEASGVPSFQTSVCHGLVDDSTAVNGDLEGQAVLSQFWNGVLGSNIVASPTNLPPLQLSDLYTNINLQPTEYNTLNIEIVQQYLASLYTWTKTSSTSQITFGAENCTYFRDQQLELKRAQNCHARTNSEPGISELIFSMYSNYHQPVSICWPPKGSRTN